MDSNLNLGMFKAYDIRTKVELLDEDNVQRLVSAIGSYIKEALGAKSVLLCRDARLAGPWLMERLISGLQAMGLKLLVNSLPVSTCQFYYSCMLHGDCAAIMVTASHNPANYIGCKLMAPGYVPLASGYGPKGGIFDIKRRYLENKAVVVSSVPGSLELIQETDQFVDYSLTMAQVGPHSLEGVSILCEFLSGSAGYEVMKGLQAAGASCTANNLIPDGYFRQGDPNPVMESSIAPTRKLLQAGDYDLCFCFDGDGDRLDVMDGKGRQLATGFVLACIMPYILDLFHEAFPGEAWHPHMYADVKAMPSALIEIAKAGVDVHLVRNGHSFIKGLLKDHFNEQFLVSEEESAHYYMNFPLDPEDWSKGHAAVENTLFFALLIAKAWKEHRDVFDHLFEVQSQSWRVKEWPLYFNSSPGRMDEILYLVEQEMVRRGAVVIKTMEDGSDLDATIMRYGLPACIDKDTSLQGSWWQVSQRIARSEDAMTRWEVVASNQSLCDELNSAILSIAQNYVEAGLAHF